MDALGPWSRTWAYVGYGAAVGVLALAGLWPAVAHAEEPAEEPAPAAREAEALLPPEPPAGRSGTTPEKGFTSGSDIGDTFREIRKLRASRFDLGLGRFARDVDERLYRKTRLKFAVAYTMVYQHASDGSGPRDAFGGDFDFIAAWSPVGRKGRNQGSLEARFETRHKIETPIAPSGLSRTIDSLWPTVSGYGVQDFALTQLYWRQDFLGDRLQVRLGKVSALAMFFGNRLNSSDLFFLNYAFADEPTAFTPGNGFGVQGKYKLSKRWAVIAGVQNANGRKTKIDPSTLELGEFWYAAQVEFTPTIRGLGHGTYRLAAWHVDERKGKSEAGSGGVLSIDQELSKKAVAFLRYGWQGQGLISPIVRIQSLTGTEHALRVGLGWQGPVKAWPDDYAGIAFAWGKPSDSRARDSFVSEIFYRSQLTDTSHVSLGLQLIESSTVFDQVAVLGARFRIEF